jgi:hypothetical protein
MGFTAEWHCWLWLWRHKYVGSCEERQAEEERWGLRFHVIPSQGFAIGLFKEEEE